MLSPDSQFFNYFNSASSNNRRRVQTPILNKKQN